MARHTTQLQGVSVLLPLFFFACPLQLLKFYLRMGFEDLEPDDECAHAHACAPGLRSF